MNAADVFSLRRWQIAIRYCDLSTSARAVAWALATWPPEDCRPSAETLAKATGMERARVFDHLKALEERGLIVRQGLGKARVFKLTIPADLVVLVAGQLGNRPIHRTVGELQPSNESHEPSNLGASNRPAGWTGEVDLRDKAEARAREASARCAALHNDPKLRYHANGLCEICMAEPRRPDLPRQEATA